MTQKTQNRLLILLIALVLSVSFILWPFKNASANSTQNYQQQIQELESQNEHTHDTVDALQLGARNLKEAIDKLQNRINELQAKISANKAKSAQLQKEIKAAEVELAKQREVLGTNIKTMYLEGDISTIEMLATSKDLSQFVDKQQYRNVVSDKIKAQLDLITALKKKLATQREEVEAIIKEDEEMRQEIGEQKAEQNRLLAMNQSQQAEFNEQIKKNNVKIDELRKAQAELEAALARQRYQTTTATEGYVNAGAVIGRVGNTGLSTGAHLHLEYRINGGVTNPGPYIEHDPVPGSYVTQGYWAYNPIYLSDRHPGIDYSVGNGNIHAIAGGTLYRGCSDDLLGTSTNPYGYVAIIDHGGGRTSIYAHMSGGPARCNYNTYW